jgi:pyruvate formate lyase activating enzyme
MKLEDMPTRAAMWRTANSKVECLLTPRHCRMGIGQTGFCRVRKNIGGALHSLIYGKTVQLTQETIETEAVFHYAPGASILSLGNIGCMLACDFCQNWQTAQVQHLDEKEIHHHTPEQVVEIALSRGIPILSWTYNDPVVWFEFVMDTARLARQKGLKNLFKSSFFVSLEAAAELCDVIDVFSISIKSMDEAFYRRLTKGWLPPVLEATKLVFANGKHVEVSNLLITDVNDSEESVKRMAAWVLDNLSDRVPLHFVRFHPDYRYTHVPRTPVDRLHRAREIAEGMGIKYCYIGNVQEWANTLCPSCGHCLVSRYGLNAHVSGITEDNRCRECGMESSITRLRSATVKADDDSMNAEWTCEVSERRFEWRGDTSSIHIVGRNESDVPGKVICRRLCEEDNGAAPVVIPLSPREEWRFCVSKGDPMESGVTIEHQPYIHLQLFQELDRAHFPTHPDMDGYEWTQVESSRLRGRD